jgi:alkylhydroperoxidase family enzyme
VARVAPAFDPSTLHTDDMPAGDLINLDVAAILAHCPDAAAALGATVGTLRAKGTVGQRLFELIRLRIAFHNQCRSCMAVRYPESIDDGLTEELVCSLEKPYEAPDLSESDRAALAFADLFATDHLRIGDDTYDEMRRFFTEAQLVEIGLICATSVGIGRLAATWQVTEHVGASPAGPEPAGPWNTHAALASPAIASGDPGST